MFLVTLIVTNINGAKTSIYYFVWMMVGYYAYKDKLDDMKFMMKIVIFINIAVAAAVFLLADKKSLTYLSSESKSDFLIGVLIMLVPKVFIYFYCENTLKKEISTIEGTDSNQEFIEVKLEQPLVSKPVQQASQPANSTLSEMVSSAIKGFKDGMSETNSTSKAEFFDLNSVGQKPKASIGSNVLMIFFGLIWVGLGTFLLQVTSKETESLVFYLLILFGSVIALIYSFITFQAMRERGWEYWIDVLKGIAFVVAIGVGIASLYDYFK